MTVQYDLHTHTTLTDGELLPTELIRRMAVLGYTTVAITDHADRSNIDTLVSTIEKIRESAEHFGVRLLTGVELTHVPPREISLLAGMARKAGAQVVVVHGETTVEPVAEGTNLAACGCSEVDILAHPGLLTSEEAELAKENGVMVELTSRGGHNRTNGHVARVAREAGCTLVVNSDAHAPHDLLDKRAKFIIATGSGLKNEEASRAISLNIEKIFPE
ncbi:histidinol phosphatase-like PHP family hydrolase [Methanolinea mesophila]|uniref:histidinol phosphate phosphatase domain-containing protein n=1 Tax=Methanolinea mesophila TaxID=547055 RepID=UPI001AE6271D|nr:histidinol phosphate phosphatase domain-containing protein [Methanolinea mesophila]MBP1929287.1 histidinol phosphatase-like PHP family hydrolase [Methanolinea mesophila]